MPTGRGPSVGTDADALEAFAQGLRLMLPVYARLPEAFGQLAGYLAQALLSTSTTANLPIPDDLRPHISALTE